MSRVHASFFFLSLCVVRSTTFAEGDAGRLASDSSRGARSAHKTIPSVIVGRSPTIGGG
jgi:hypothetical protein